MADSSNEDRARDALNLYFEFFKHFTTLTTATALVVLAFYGALKQSSPVAYLGWISLGITLFLSLFSMLSVVFRVSKGGWRSVEEPGLGFVILAAITVASFFAGIVVFVSVLTNPMGPVQPLFPF